MTAQTRSEIAGLLDRHGVLPDRRLGQHFLADANITRKIVSVAGIVEGDRVVEVGAGTGTLTAALARAGAHVVAYEIDRRLEPVLVEVTSGLDVELRMEDAMDSGLAVDDGPWKMVANLPYNVGTPLLLDTLRHRHGVTLFVVMVQREVARRLAASAGTPDYGLPSVVARIYGDPRVEMVVPPQVFYPPPRVESAVVVIRRLPAPSGAEAAVALAATAFGQRRKMLRRSLAGHLDDPVGWLESVGLDPTARAEDLSAADYLALARGER